MINFFLDPEQEKEFEFDFYRYDADPANLPLIASFLSYKTGLDLNIGTALKVSFIEMEFRYSYSLIEAKNIVGLTLFEYFDSYYLYMSIKF